jgi:DNA gyrase/topoisomerase IV subunit A
MKIRQKTITRQINTKFREYAVYTLENRGIPNFYDALTNAQRIALLLAPRDFKKTISLVGDCISNNYHHGDVSLSGVISRMAKPHGCSTRLLEGDGFFGSAISNEAAAPRYTSIRLNPLIRPLIKELDYLNTLPEDDTPKRMHTYFPLGMLVGIMGIAVGYKTIILPRKFEEIQKYLEGDSSANLHPFFENFQGQVSKIDKEGKFGDLWLIEGVVKFDMSLRKIIIHDLPPIMKYSSFVQKLDNLLDEVDCSILNQSSDEVRIEIQFGKGISVEIFEEVLAKIQKATRILVAENIVFVKDHSVLTYSKFEHYLEDFRDENLRTQLKSYQYKISAAREEIDFLNAKKKFIPFMLERKRNQEEVKKFLVDFSSSIKSRLSSLTAVKLVQEELDEIEVLLKEEASKVEDYTKQISQYEKKIKKLPLELRNMQIVYEEDQDLDDLLALTGAELYQVENEANSVSEIKDEEVPAELNEF